MGRSGLIARGACVWLGMIEIAPSANSVGQFDVDQVSGCAKLSWCVFRVLGLRCEPASCWRLSDELRSECVA